MISSCRRVEAPWYTYSQAVSVNEHQNEGFLIENLMDQLELVLLALALTLQLFELCALRLDDAL